MTPSDRVIILLEGQIGVGKTTVGEILEHRLGVPLYRELHNPVTATLLDRYYLDQRRWAYTMQTHFLAERFRMIREIAGTGRGIMDRSIHGDHIFARMLAERGYMDAEEFHAYTALLEGILEYTPAPTLLVYLDCSVDTAMERIRGRNRGYESEIPRAYLEELNQRYLTWITQYDAAPKVMIDTEQFHIDRSEEMEPALQAIISQLDAGDSTREKRNAFRM